MLIARRLAPVLCSIASAAAHAQSPADFFELKIRPVLAKNCLSCHGASAMGGLRLDSREALVKGAKSGPVITAGNATGSPLIQAINHTHPRVKMPPQGKLAEAEIANLTEWVNAGAAWPATTAATPARNFWSFQPVKSPPIPQIKNTAWPITVIDRFVLAGLEQNNLTPVKPASKQALLRRASYDLTGLPPTPQELDAFLADTGPRAFATVVDRLLASPHYGERWGRYWLDLARYSDGQLDASKDKPFPNSFRYRDWVVNALNSDMPYNTFVKAQIAADFLDDEKLLPGLGFYGLGPGEDDRVDVTGQVFLGLTVGCARCHDHKYDPIATKDFYSLQGVFKSSQTHEFPLAPEANVKAYQSARKEIEDQKNTNADFVLKHSTDLGEILVRKTAPYMLAAWDKLNGATPDPALNEEITSRMAVYLKTPGRDHHFLDKWDDLLARKAPRAEVEGFAAEFQKSVIEIFDTKHAMDDRNYVKLGGAAGVRDEAKRQYTNLESLPIEQYYLWRELASEPHKRDFVDVKNGVFYFGPKDIDRYLAPEWREYYAAMKARLTQLEKALPAQYPFLHTLKDAEKPSDMKVYIRGDAATPGEVAPRRFLPVLCDGESAPFTKGSGRLELANAIASPTNPLTARVMVNRIWQHHFGQGIVRTPSNFGQMGERPDNPELLDYLAAKFVESGWSMKAMHREIMLSSVYQLSTDTSETNVARDPANRLHWRANLQQRLDWEALRDSLLAVSGQLDSTIGGPSAPLTDTNHRRTLYATAGRTKPDPIPALFDFPNPNATSEQRMVTVGPMQRLYFMNNSFVAAQATALAERLKPLADDDRGRIRQVYRLLYSRFPTEDEVRLGLVFLENDPGKWPQYTQVLMSSAEFNSVK